MRNWIIPCSPNIYDAEAAFREYGHVVWHQQFNVEIGDYAYIYVTAPAKAIRCRCRIEATNIPADTSADDGYVLDEAFCSKSYHRYMDLKLMEIYDSPLLSFQMLQANGLAGTIRGQRRVGPKLDAYLSTVIASLEKEKNHADN